MVFAFRDAEEQAHYGSQTLPPGRLALDLARVRERGMEAGAQEAVRHLTREGGPNDGFWIHLDADILDDAIMPAVDHRLPGGLSWVELAAVLRIAVESGRAVGIEITIYNPKLDPDGTSGKGRAATVVKAFAD